MPVNTQQLMRQYDELAADNARLLNEIERLRTEVERLKEMYRKSDTENDELRAELFKHAE